MATEHDDLKAWERGERRGNYAMLSGILMAAMIGFAAFSVDVALITMAELQAQATADSASHAALIGYRVGGSSTSIGQNRALWITNYNKVGLGTATLDSVAFGVWNFTNSTFTANGGNGPVNAARATVSRQGGNAVNLLLAPLLGVNTYNVDATAITSTQDRAIMLVMDLSCSMFTGSWNDPNSAVNVGRTANQSFIQYLDDNPQRGDLVGLSMFGQRAAGIGTAGTGITSNVPTVAQRPWLPLSSMETQEQLIRDRMYGICDTGANLCGGLPHPMDWSIGGCTNPGPAMQQAVNELVTYANSTYFKGMVFFSDGVPNCSQNGTWDEPDAIARAMTASDRAWTNGIYVWTILYHNGSFNAQFMTDLVRGAPLAFTQSTPTPAQLPGLYQQVAKSLPTALVQ